MLKKTVTETEKLATTCKVLYVTNFYRNVQFS